MVKPVVIVGGGVAGLACARRLYEAGIRFLLLEASNRIGGRLKTESFEGFLLDRGFHVYFEAYPHGQALLDFDALKFGRFQKGSYVFHGGKLNLVENKRTLRNLLDPFLKVSDKLKLNRLAKQCRSSSVLEIRAMTDDTTENHLREYGFSEAFLDRFARPFFGGIFLDRSLQVSRRQFTFVFNMLLNGEVSLPAGGIEAIPRNIVNGIPSYFFRTYSRAEEILFANGQAVGVRLDTNERIDADMVVVATEADVAAKLVGIEFPAGYKSSSCVYFETPTPCVDRPLLVLNGTGEGKVNEVAPLSSAQPKYAPEGKHLASATILGWDSTPDEELAEQVKRELKEWFPTKGVNMWRFLRVYRTRFAQMEQPAGFETTLPSVVTEKHGVFLAGEFTQHSSIDGAMESGIRCARQIVQRGKALVSA